MCSSTSVIRLFSLKSDHGDGFPSHRKDSKIGCGLKTVSCLLDKFSLWHLCILRCQLLQTIGKQLKASFSFILLQENRSVDADRKDEVNNHWNITNNSIAVCFLIISIRFNFGIFPSNYQKIGAFIVAESTTTKQMDVFKDS